METPCGFDDTFFKLFTECLSKKQELYSHGLLSVDEMTKRQNVNLTLFKTRWNFSI